jgi:predicted ABC-type ATPase
MLNEIEGFAQRRVDFGFETTLSGLAHLNLIRRLKRRRYKTNIFYLWVPSADAALSRVRERVSSGGHDIPEPIVRRRFDRSIRNFLGRYRKLADLWILFNNSEEIPSIIARENGEGFRIVDRMSYNLLIERYGQT